MNKIIGILIICLPIMTIAQDSLRTTGVKWTEGLSWEQVKEKAKRENKFIFIDCYATWCMPCKKMDKEIYTNDTIGNYFKDNFISIKVQMDKTGKDDEYIRSWYYDAVLLSKEFKIAQYPSFIFLSPQGVIVHKGIGYKNVKDFLMLAQIAIVPDKVYDNPYKEYDELIKEYKQGVKHYERMPYMIQTALKLQDNGFAVELVKDHTNYIMTLPEGSRYTKNNIEMWSSFSLSSKTRIFQFFYKDGVKIDKVMCRKGYASKIVDRTIMDEIITPFFKEQNKNTSISMSGMYLNSANLSSDSSEADWKKLEKLIRIKFRSFYAKRNVLIARIEWYKRHRNISAAAKYSLLYLDKYSSIENENLYSINSTAFEAFLHSTDKKIIDGFIVWMGKVIVKTPADAGNIDTYASLLYKAGRIAEAIKWEEKAAKLLPDDEEILNALKNMKAGKPTYVEDGAIWENN